MLDTLKKRNPKWLIWYSIPAVIGIAVICLFMNLFNNTFFAGGDGYIMTYTATVYIKEFWQSIFTGSLPMMDFTMGEGLDPIVSLIYYGLSDPMSFIFAIVPENALVFAFNCTTILKLLLSGLTFGLFASRHSKDDKAVGMGAVVYTFSAFLLFWMYHPGIMSGGYLLPLLLIAFDKALDEKQYMPLAFATLFAYVTNYYIAAVLSFMLLTYAIIRLCMNNTWTKSSIWHYFKTAGAHALGILASMFVLLPMVLALLGGARDNPSGGYSQSLLLFNPGYYLDTLIGMFTSFNNAAHYWVAPYKMHTGFLCIAAPSLVLFISTKTEPGSKERRLKWALLACALFTCVPMFSKLFNLWMYPTHRWAVAFALVMGMITTWAIPKFCEMKAWQKWVSAALVLCSAIGSLFVMYPRGAIPMIVLSLITIPVMLVKPRRLTAYIATVLALVIMLFSSFTGNRYGAYFTDKRVSQFAHNTIYSAVELSDEELEELVRVGCTATDDAVNSGMLIGYNTTSAIWNVMPAGTCDWNYKVNQFAESDVNFWVHGWDDRTAAFALAGTKYFVADKDGQACVPSGFTFVKEVSVSPTINDPTGEKADVYYVYENQHHIGVGYVMDKTMSYEEFMKLDIASKQIAMMQYAIVESAPQTDFKSHAFQIPFTITQDENIITLSCNIPEGYEVYLGVDNIEQIIWPSKVTVRDMEYWQSNNANSNTLSDGESAEEKVTSTNSAATAFVTVTDQNGLKISKEIAATRKYAHITSGSGKRTLNLGSQLQGDTTIEILRNSTAVKIEGLSLWAMPVSEYAEAANILSLNTLAITNSSNNAIEGSLKTSKSGIMQLAVPYQAGWKAYIDGQEVDIVPCGIKYMGIEVTEGEHDIRFEYTTPGLSAGAIISGVSFATMCALLFIEQRKKKKH